MYTGTLLLSSLSIIDIVVLYIDKREEDTFFHGTLAPLLQQTLHCRAINLNLSYMPDKPAYHWDAYAN